MIQTYDSAARDSDSNAATGSLNWDCLREEISPSAAAGLLDEGRRKAAKQMLDRLLTSKYYASKKTNTSKYTINRCAN